MFQRLSEILETNNECASIVRGCRLLEYWGEVIDERVKNNAEAIKVRNKVLYVNTSSPAWAQELSLLKSEIIDKFNNRAGEQAINDIRFRCN